MTKQRYSRGSPAQSRRQYAARLWAITWVPAQRTALYLEARLGAADYGVWAYRHWQLYAYLRESCGWHAVNPGHFWKTGALWIRPL